MNVLTARSPFASAAGDLADRAVRRWQQVHGDHELTCEVAAAGAVLDGDPVLLRRVLDNLLDNAVRHGGAGQPVTLRVAANDGAVGFEVVDRGPGLSADELAHVFTPFWRSDGSRTRDTGGVACNEPAADAPSATATPTNCSAPRC